MLEKSHPLAQKLVELYPQEPISAIKKYPKEFKEARIQLAKLSQGRS